MNTYKIKALSSRTNNAIKLVFTVDAETLIKAEEEGRAKLTREGHKYGVVDTITELGPSKVSSPAAETCMVCGRLTALSGCNRSGCRTPRTEVPTIANRAPREPHVTPRPGRIDGY